MISLRAARLHPERRGGKEKRKGGQMATDDVINSHTRVEKDRQSGFWARNSVAVAPAFAQCTNRCNCRKVTVNAQPTNREDRKLKKTSRHEDL